ncbi:cyclic nucleotide-binding domain-containing protein [Methylobacterium nodulans]|uniref:Cyclic nucleotide-binding protein n=1 Tax=Methylobacterium nodulans (strain LMG 21967 / CNCM I-2342 / ORS 2060) TaxID=460265 RepID=B8II18_METNO|nr:cyclic nucleotide-binding domain-containing protein [Methylobacterium nodulans]ACL56056.1 cyclic nucleotide-binding protein [Methylobacterium nodulans ORS 2060]
MNWVEAIGYLGTALTITSSAMTTMIPLRILSILASVAVITYGILTGSLPVVLTEAIQIPFNTWRLYQMVKLVRDVEKAADGDLSLDWLKPFGTSRRFRAGEVLFRMGDPASEMYYVESGRFRIEERGIDIAPGAIVGELGMLSPGNVRTASVVCAEDGVALCVPYSEVKQLYYQNPEFGFYFLKLTSERLFQGTGQGARGAVAIPEPEVA